MQCVFLIFQKFHVLPTVQNFTCKFWDLRLKDVYLFIYLKDNVIGKQRKTKIRETDTFYSLEVVASN